MPPAAARNLLFVGLEFETFERFSAARVFRDCRCDFISSGSHAAELLELLPYEGIVVAHPLPDIGTAAFLESIRRPGSGCRTAAVILLATGDGWEDARNLVGAGANQVLTGQEPAAALAEVLDRLFQVAPRIRARVISRLVVPGPLGQRRLLCQTVNLSASGMLIQTNQSCEPGTELEFELSLPGEQGAVRGRARVIRQTRARRERTTGLGLQFSHLSQESRQRLDAHLHAHFAGRIN